jgi:hypothetical protein
MRVLTPWRTIHEHNGDGGGQRLSLDYVAVVKWLNNDECIQGRELSAVTVENT